jgi:hypothetical protein
VKSGRTRGATVIPVRESKTTLFGQAAVPELTLLPAPSFGAYLEMDFGQVHGSAMQKTGRVCAYCGSNRGLTNEHLFPDCIYERTPGSMISIARTSEGDKAIGGALEIGDVCARCNNGKLSVLDTYICELHDKYFKTIIHAGDRVDFHFDFDLLLRWLLKTGYNTARARGWHVKRDSELPQYILGEGQRPSGFRVFLQLIIPTPTSSREWVTKPDAAEVPPAPVRIDLLDVSKLAGFNMGYVVSLNSYLFTIFKEVDAVPSRIRKLVLINLLKHMLGACEITDKERAIVYSSSLDFMALVDKNSVLLRHLEMMQRHNDQLKRKKLTSQK